MIGGFGQSGQAQSQQYAWQACSICNAPIRVSWFLIGCFGLQVVSALQNGARVWDILLLCGQEAVLILTVLCHEFGHGNAARAIGGHIDHILLWPFGGICFTSRPRDVTDPKRILRNDLIVVASGPATHFLMTPIWASLLYAVTAMVEPVCAPHACASCSGVDCIWHAVNPFGPPLMVYAGPDGVFMGEAFATLWRLLGIAVQMNVALFIFNVFFPMYPADGAKLLTVSLMHCCGTSPRTAATVLITSSTICASLLISYALWCMRTVDLHSGGIGIMMFGIMGWMGVMSLIEAYNIYQLRAQQRLHTHPLFQNARSWGATNHDDRGAFHHINGTDLDDSDTGAPGTCCLFACCGSSTSEEEREIEFGTTLGPNCAPCEEAGAQREKRDRLLKSVENQQAQNAKTVRQLEDERILSGARS